VSRQSVNAIESGKYVPSTILALKIAQVFKKKCGNVVSAGTRRLDGQKSIKGIFITSYCRFIISYMKMKIPKYTDNF